MLHIMTFIKSLNAFFAADCILHMCRPISSRHRRISLTNNISALKVKNLLGEVVQK